MCLGASGFALACAIWLSRAPDISIPENIHTAQLGSLDEIKLIKKGDIHYSLNAKYARESYLSVGGGIATTLATYYELYAVTFESSLTGLGHVYFTAPHAKMDLLMKKLRLEYPASIKFSSGYHAKAKSIEINLISGQIKPEGISMNIHGNEIPVGTREWQIDQEN